MNIFHVFIKVWNLVHLYSLGPWTLSDMEPSQKTPPGGHGDYFNIRHYRIQSVLSLNHTYRMCDVYNYNYVLMVKDSFTPGKVSQSLVHKWEEGDDGEGDQPENRSSRSGFAVSKSHCGEEKKSWALRQSSLSSEQSSFSLSPMVMKCGSWPKV